MHNNRSRVIFAYMEKYKHFDVYNEMPEGWKIDKTFGSPLYGSIGISDGKSLINGGKRALLHVLSKANEPVTDAKEVAIQAKGVAIQAKGVAIQAKVDNDYVFPAKTVNTLARKKFQEQILKEIMFDLMVCEIEGWSKHEYINELKKLINGINTSNRKTISVKNDLTLFD